MNDARFTGRLTKDPVKRETTTGIAVCNFTIAVQRPGTKREDRISDYIDCVVWRGGAEVIEKYYHKGDGIIVSGHMQNRQWTDKDGNQRSGMELVVEDFEFPMSKRTDGQQTQKPADAPAPVDDEPLPF